MTTSNSKIKTHSIGILCDMAGDYNFYFLNASEADMQEMFMEYCRDMVDDSLMEHQFEAIQKDSDNDWYWKWHYHWKGIRKAKKRIYY